MILEEHLHLPTSVKPSKDALGEAHGQVFFTTHFTCPLLELTATGIPRTSPVPRPITLHLTLSQKWPPLPNSASRILRCGRLAPRNSQSPLSTCLQSGYCRQHKLPRTTSTHSPRHSHRLCWRTTSIPHLISAQSTCSLPAPFRAPLLPARRRTATTSPAPRPHCRHPTRR